jgi:hypothetical protein
MTEWLPFSMQTLKEADTLFPEAEPLAPGSLILSRST